MANRFELFSRIRLVRGRSRPLTKVVVLCAIVLSTVTLLSLQVALRSAEDQTDALRDQAAYLEQEKNRLQNNIAALGSVDSAERIAEEELGLGYPDSIVFQPVG